MSEGERRGARVLVPRKIGQKLDWKAGVRLPLAMQIFDGALVRFLNRPV